MSTSSTPTPGNDLIIGTAAPDSINGLQGNDIISGQEGDDSLIGAEGADSLYGGAGNDQLFGGGSSNTSVGPNSPIPIPGDLADSIEGGSGNDILRGNAGNDTLRGGDGDDNLRGDYGDDLIDGGDGIDFVAYYYQPLGLTSGLRFNASSIGTGSSGSETFSDLIGGTDTLISIERVIFTGTDFADTVTGAQNADQLSGEGGDDSIDGGSGNDLLIGGLGNDTLSGGYGDDRLDGGEGIDTATYMSRRENYTLSRGSDGNWTVSFSGPIIAIFPAPPTEGTDTLINVENVQFADAVLNLADIASVIPTVQFTTTASSANEGNSGSTTVNVQAALSAASTQTVTVPISYTGTALSGTDYTNATGFIIIPPGQTTGTATFSVIGDTNVEPNETVILTLRTPTNAMLGTNATYTHTIGNDDSDVTPPSIQIYSPNTSIVTGDVATIFFQLSEPSTDFTASDITVQGGQIFNFSGQNVDYRASFMPHGWISGSTHLVKVESGRFADNSGNKNIDGSEPNNSLMFEVRSKSLADSLVVDPISGHYYQFVNNGVRWKDAIVLSEASSYRGLVGYLATVSSAAENSYVLWSILGSGPSNRVWIGISDEKAEGNWTYRSGPEKGQAIVFSNWDTSEPNGGSTSNYATIYPYSAYDSARIGAWDDVPNDTDNSWLLNYVIEYGGLPATYTITPSATSVNEGSSVTFTIDTKNVEWGKTVSYTLTGISQSDLASGSLTGTAVVNQQGVDGRATVTVALAADNLVEGPELLRLTVGSTTSAPVTVVDLSPVSRPTVQFATSSGSAAEGNSGTSTITVQVAISAASTQTVTVPISYTGTATQNIDYTNATSNITIPAGQTTGTVTFTVLGDTTVEPNETVVLSMGTPTNAVLGTNTIYTHTIVNDDPTTTQAPTGAFLRQAGHVVLDSQFVNVYGASALEVVVLGTDAANVVIDQNVERIHLPLDFQLYGYVQTGNLLNVYPARGGSVVMSVAVQNDSDGTVLVFPNGAISTKLTPISPTSPVPGIALGAVTIATDGSPPTAVPAFVPQLLPFPIPTPPQPPSDTSVFMGRDALFKAAVNGLRVYGSLGSETLAMANGVSAVVADQNIEAVRFEQRLSSYSFQQTGNVLNIHERASGVKLLEIPIQADADGTQLSFAGRSFAAKISAGVMRLGDKAVAQERPTPIESSVVVSVDRGGSFNADTDDVRFEFVAGTYNYSIAGFSAADQLVFPQGAVPSVSNTSYTDGRVNLGWALGGQTIAVTITGLTTGQDAALNSTGDFNTVFGAGTVS